MWHRCLDEPHWFPSRLVGGVPVAVDEALGKYDCPVESAPVDLKFKLPPEAEPGQASHPVRLTYWTLVLWRETFCCRFSLSEEFAEAFHVHSVSPFLILDPGPVLRD